ncbi:MAG: 30S ribosomal protein S28e [Candidatus Nanohaloarchaea archaeon]|nr:30S ribosomal protein S28e [Candidatus Nanohaloarchaea archaeon]MDY6766119.1 30S ribosomal protein S28e [Candidatus Nanohaloarchaea archaeon]
MAVPAEVVQVLGEQGHRGVKKVRCKITEGSDEGKILVRDVMGPVREDDVLMLEETEME